MRRLDPKQRGLAIPMVFVLVVSTLTIVLFLFQFSRESFRRSTRGIHATAAEVLAQSAVEEIFYQVQRDCNDPTKPEVFEAFRGNVANGADPTPLPVSIPDLKARLKDPKFNGFFESRFDPDAPDAFEVSATVTFKNPYEDLDVALGSYADGAGSIGSTVPKERVGILTMSATVEPTLFGNIDSVRRFTVQHTFRVAQATPPIPFGMSGLVIMYPEYMTLTETASIEEFDLNAWRTRITQGGGGKGGMDQTLGRLNTAIEDINTYSKEANSIIGKMKDGVGGHEVTPPPEWLQKLIDDLEGVLDKANSIKILPDQGSASTRPFLFRDAVMFSRPLQKDMGNLDAFNYQKHLDEKLKPIQDVIDALQSIIEVNNRIMDALMIAHAIIPYGPGLDVLECLVCSITSVPCNGCGADFANFCRKAHEKFLDEILRVQMGIAQVLCLVQKIMIEFPAMGQQAFQATTDRFKNQVGSYVQSQMPGFDLNSVDLTGMAALSPVAQASGDLGFPQYGLGPEFSGGEATYVAANARSRKDQLFEALLQEIRSRVQGMVAEQITAMAGRMIANLIVSVIPVAGWAAGAAIDAALTVLFRQLQRVIDRTFRSISGRTQGIITFVTDELIGELPFFKQHEVLSELELPALCGVIIEKTIEREDDLTEAVEEWLTKLQQKFGERFDQVATQVGGTDVLGGIVKGFVLRHRQRNMIEFDPLGTDLFDNMRGIFDQAFDQDIFKKKATWVISDIKHFEMLENRYVLGQFGNVMGAATPGDLHYWKSDSSYKPNIEFGAYGLNGIIFYTGTADLVLKYPDPGRGIGPFRGKCTIYATEANIILEDLKLERREEDVLTVITLKDVEIKGGTDPVEVAIAAVGSESKFKNPTERAIFGNVVLKRYTVDQNKSQAESLQGDLEYNEMLDAGSRDDPRGNHLFVSISPYRLAQDMDVTE